MTRLHSDWIPAGRSSACGANASLPNGFLAWKKCLDRAAPGLFPPELVVKVKALACELPSQHQKPLARWSVPELTRYIRDSGLVASISDSTLWRWLHEDAIRPRQHRCWIFPRDPDPTLGLDFGEPPGPREGGTYEALHRDVLVPMGELFALIREISGAIQHEIGAFG